MFTTPITLPPSPFSLTPTSHAIMLGSCFADEIGSRLADSLPEGNVDVNPFGVLYNPASIALALRFLITPEPAEDMLRPYIFQGHDGLFHSWAHSTHFSATTFDDCLTKCSTRLTSARKILSQSDLLVITLGTDRAYKLKDSLPTEMHRGEAVVANCHKEPSNLFTEEDVISLKDLIPVEGKIQGELPTILRQVKALYPTLNIVLTVSPYRYKKYGFHESQLSKARLLLLCDALCNTTHTIYEDNNDSSHPLPSPSLLPPYGGGTGRGLKAGERPGGRMFYFPAYEILLDELRDYRFYADDMLHPSQVAVNYIWQLFQQWSFSPDLIQFAQQRQKQLRQQRHRPITKC